MSTQKAFGITDVGRWIDGAFGEQHTRNKLADMVESLDGRHKLVAELRGEPSDNFGEEDDALDVLNANCDERVYFKFVNGDLLCCHNYDGGSDNE